jgi:hypothetical protein
MIPVVIMTCGPFVLAVASGMIGLGVAIPAVFSDEVGTDKAWHAVLARSGLKLRLGV